MRLVKANSLDLFLRRTGMVLILEHIGVEGPGRISGFLAGNKIPFKTIELWRSEVLPDALPDIEAIISLGGPMNVYEEDKYPFLKKEDEFLKKALEKEISVLGICLGAQLLAKAAGAEVKRSFEKEIGWGMVRLTDTGKKDPLFKGLENNLEVFQWHEDQFDVPQQAVLLAESEKCRNQAFRLGKNAYGIQFHIEVTTDMIGSWIKEYLYNKDQFKVFDKREINLDACKEEEKFAKQAEIILSNFFNLSKKKNALS